MPKTLSVGCKTTPLGDIINAKKIILLRGAHSPSLCAVFGRSVRALLARISSPLLSFSLSLSPSPVFVATVASTCASCTNLLYIYIYTYYIRPGGRSFGYIRAGVLVMYPKFPRRVILGVDGVFPPWYHMYKR